MLSHYWLLIVSFPSNASSQDTAGLPSLLETVLLALWYVGTGEARQ